MKSYSTLKSLPVKVVDRESELSLVIAEDEYVAEDEEEVIEGLGDVATGALGDGEQHAADGLELLVERQREFEDGAMAKLKEGKIKTLFGVHINSNHLLDKVTKA